MKNYKLLIALAASLTLAGCSTSNVSKGVDSLDDFVVVATASELNIASCDATIGAVSSMSGKDPGQIHKTALYQDHNFTLAANKNNSLGYTYKVNGKAQYVVVDTKTKYGVIYDEPTVLNAALEAAIAQIATDYAALEAVYAEMKASIGKSAAELGVDSFSMARTVADNVAGYETSSTLTLEGVTTETNRYLTLDRFGDKWAFTNYTERKTITSTDADGNVSVAYATSDYQIGVVEELPVAHVSLSGYILSPEGYSVDNVTLEDGIPLTSK